MSNRESQRLAEISELAWERSATIGRREQARVLADLVGRTSKAAGRLLARIDSERGGPLRLGAG